ncbi:MAG TPA: trehalose-phosphatase [Bryobacteraceae bacterium]|nr:trehalose-phosphatase [Bryobacteraceae bacterium]
MFNTLTPVISEVREHVGTSGFVSLFLDFDGTLVPITADPSAPLLDPDTAEILHLISGQDVSTTTIISGRAVEDLYARIRLAGLIYAGNHGLEVFGRNLRFVEPLAWERRDPLARLCEKLAAELAPIDGAAVECKGLTASVHYRLADVADWPEIQRIVYAAAARNNSLFRIAPGRKTFDIVPRTSWHKGALVEWINRQFDRKDTLTVYVGDDDSDEEAFSVLSDAITIKVGDGPLTCARHQLPDPVAVHEFLLWMATQLS